MDIDEIGDDNAEALLCHFDGVECCGGDKNDSSAQVHWYSPDGSVIMEESSHDNGGSGMFSDVIITNQSFAVSRDEGVVRLFQSHSAVTPTTFGMFCCVLPDAEHMACANIGKWLYHQLYFVHYNS